MPKQASVEDLVGQIDGIFSDERNCKFLQVEGELDQPTTISIGGRLFGYDPKHSVGVQIDSRVYDKVGLVRRIEFVDMNRSSIVRECFLATDGEIVDGLTQQPLDQTGRNNLSFWLNETWWGSDYTKRLSQRTAKTSKYTSEMI